VSRAHDGVAGRVGPLVVVMSGADGAAQREGRGVLLVGWLHGSVMLTVPVDEQLVATFELDAGAVAQLVALLREAGGSSAAN
jgi:hypothetical protein